MSCVRPALRSRRRLFQWRHGLEFLPRRTCSGLYLSRAVPALLRDFDAGGNTVSVICGLPALRCAALSLLARPVAVYRLAARSCLRGATRAAPAS